MTTEIHGLPGGLVQNTGENTLVNGTREKGTTSGNALSSQVSMATGDSVSLSHSATRLQALEARIAELPVVDRQRVDSVRHDIAAGTFTVDPMGAADKMLQMERALV